jgi:hypothetical protein
VTSGLVGIRRTDSAERRADLAVLTARLLPPIKLEVVGENDVRAI